VGKSLEFSILKAALGKNLGGLSMYAEAVA
jgi:hypothetical protein